MIDSFIDVVVEKKPTRWFELWWTMTRDNKEKIFDFS